MPELIYNVQPGDTLYTISLLFDVSLESILRLNDIIDILPARSCRHERGFLKETYEVVC